MVSDDKPEPTGSASLSRRATIAAAIAGGAGAAGALLATSAAIGSAMVRSTDTSDGAVADLLRDDSSQTAQRIESRMDALRDSVAANLAKTTAPVRRIAAGVDGVTGLGTVDDSAAIQAIFDEAGPGATIVVGSPGTGHTFRIDKTITITNGQQRFLGPGIDFYSSGFRRDQPGVMFSVQAPGFLVRDVALISGVDLASSKVDGFQFLGAKTSDLDARLDGVCLYQLRRGLSIHGRNVRVENCLFSNSRYGIYVGGAVPGYHEQGFESRNLVAHQNRFHGTGVGLRPGESASVHLAPEAPHRYAVVTDNMFDVVGRSRDVSILGKENQRHEHLHLVGNAHYQTTSAAYYINQSTAVTVDAAHVMGDARTAAEAAYQLVNSTGHRVSNVSIWAHRAGVSVANSVDTRMMNVDVSSCATDGFVFGAGLKDVRLMGTAAKNNQGWGYRSSGPVDVKGYGTDARGNASGQVSPSLTQLGLWA